MIRIAQVSSHCIKNGFLTNCRFQAPCFIKSLSTNASLDNWIGDNQNANSFESANEFEQRIFGGYSGGNSRSESFYQKLEKLTKGRNTSGSRPGEGDGFQTIYDLDGNFSTSSDGMNEKLQKAAQYFEVDDEEVSREDYSFRPDAHFPVGSTYDIKDLDLTKPGVRRAERENRFEVTTEEVLRKADFRNVRFLAKFMTEAGLIIKRRQTGISAKAQRRIAREIKTARAFGLMPFTTMGTKPFVFGRTMENLDKDYEYEGSLEDVREVHEA